jgi:hypothetical protein
LAFLHVSKGKLPDWSPLTFPLARSHISSCSQGRPRRAVRQPVRAVYIHARFRDWKTGL